MLDRVDVHCLLASAPILALLPNPLPDVPGGEIVRDPVTGEATGVFCDNAMDLVYALWPRPDARRKKQFTRSAMRALNAVGIVGVHDAGVIAPQELDVWREMVGEKDDGWTVRVYAMLECAARNTFGSCADEVAAMGLPERRDLRSPDVPSAHGWLMARSVKLFADGALGSWGSAMLEPYNDRPESRGALLAEPDDLVGVARAWAGAGFQVNIHAIGDRANRVAVDALLAALQESCGGGDPGRQEQQKVMVDDKGLDGLTVSTNRTRECQASRFRHRIEHAQIVHPDDQARILAAGIVPSIQPTHATSDMSYAELRLGRTRVETEAYRMRTFLRGLAVRSNETSTASDDNTHRQPHPLVLGSDFPVEPPSPLAGIYAAVTRRNPKTGHGVNGPGDHSGWYVESEGITADEALAGFTAGPAEAAFLETKAGVIAPGAFADWVVLEESWDAYALGGDEMMERLREGREVRETWVGGRMVYARDDLK